MSRKIGRAARTAVVLAALLLAGVIAPISALDERSAGELDTRRLTGKAFYENDKYTEAAAEFRQAAGSRVRGATRFRSGPIRRSCRGGRPSCSATSPAPF